VKNQMMISRTTNKHNLTLNYTFLNDYIIILNQSSSSINIAPSCSSIFFCSGS